jgi:hypothetical protein
MSAILCAAPAHAKTIKSEVMQGGVGAGSGTVTIEGHVESKRAACLRARKISFSIIDGGSTTLVGKDVSSRNGYAGAMGDGEFPDDTILRLQPKRLGESLKCSGDRTKMSDLRIARSAPREKIPGTFQYNGLAYAGGEIGAFGYVDSGKRCLAKRKVETFPFDDGVSKPARGHDISSRNGFWGTYAKSNSQGVGLRLKPKRIGGGDRCGGDVLRYDPAPEMSSARGGAVNTSIEIDGTGQSCTNGHCTQDIRVIVSANKKKCVEGRKVKFFVFEGDDKVKFDTDRTTRDGLAMGYGLVSSSAEGYQVKVEASKVGKTQCGSAKVQPT